MYPITITRQDIEACREHTDDAEGLIKAFDAIAPDGELVVADVDAHAALLRGLLAPYESAMVSAGLLPALMVSAGKHGVAASGHHGTATAGAYGIAAGGYVGTARSDDYGVAAAGYAGRAEVGVHGAAAASDKGQARAGYGGVAAAGFDGHAVVGSGGLAAAAQCGTAETGDHGTAVAGGLGTARAGDGGVAIAGLVGAAAAGHGGVIQIAYLSGDGRRRIATAYVGEDGILPHTLYRLDVSVDPPRFMRVED